MFRTLLDRMKAFFGRLRKDKKGAALVEYALLVGGIALICLVAVTFIGHKTNDILSSVAAILPGAHTDDNGPIQSGHLIETAPVTKGGPIAIDTSTIVTNSGSTRLGNNVGVNLNGLVLESN